MGIGCLARLLERKKQAVDILGQSALLVGVTSFTLGTSVLSRNVRNKLYIAFALICAIVSLWATAFYLEKIWPEGLFYRFHLLFNVWLGPAALVLTRSLVRINDAFSRRLLQLSVLVGLLLSLGLALNLDRTVGFGEWLMPLVLFCPGFVIIQILDLMWIDRRLRKGAKRSPKVPTVGLARRNLIYLGGLAVFSFSVMDHIPRMGTLLPAIGNLALTAYLFFVSQAISQQRLLNLGALISRFLVLLLVALTLTVLYSLLVAWIEDSPGLFFLNSFIASFMILSLLNPLRSLVSYFTEQLLTQKHRRLQQTIREAQQRLAGAVDTGVLFQDILRAVEETVNPQWAALFVLKSDGTKFRRVGVVGARDPQAVSGQGTLRELLADHALLQACDKQHRRGELPILLDPVLESEVERSASRAQRESFQGLREALRALGGNLLIPLFDGNSCLGFVICDAPAPPEPWGSNWGLISVIYPFFEQVAATLRNMEVFVRQREKERLATIGEMAAGLAHEIRNPLGAIKGAAQFLDPSADRPESRFLKVIIEEVDRLNHVVTQFLDYSKPSTAELKPIELSLLAKKTIEFLQPGIPGSVRVVFENQPGGPGEAWVTASPEQLRQVLINLIQNSVKSLEGRSDGRVQVSVTSDGDGPKKEAVLIVEDNGPGIRREHIEKIFIPFFTTSPSGTGLGLSICQKIIEAHQGKIEVVSEEGRFARFVITLPSKPSEDR